MLWSFLYRSHMKWSLHVFLLFFLVHSWLCILPLPSVDGYLVLRYVPWCFHQMLVWSEKGLCSHPSQESYSLLLILSSFLQLPLVPTVFRLLLLLSGSHMADVSWWNLQIQMYKILFWILLTLGSRKQILYQLRSVIILLPYLKCYFP